MPIFTVTETEGKTQILEARDASEARSTLIEDLIRPLVVGGRLIRPGMSREDASRWVTDNCAVREYESLFAMLTDSGLNPIRHYTQYKLVRQADPTEAVCNDEWEDTQIEIAEDNLMDLCASLEEAADGESPFVAMEPGGDFYEYQGGPFKFVREVVLVFDLSEAEKAEVEKIKQEHTGGS